jgi:catechol 2,3-dioxygenase-like lactoylglutathione lyase family enzyme
LPERRPDLRALNVNSVLLVEDVVATACHYRDVLGFECAQQWGNPSRFALMTRGDLEILLAEGEDSGRVRTGDASAAVSHWDVHLRVDDVDALAAELRGNGADILDGPQLSFYGMKELKVRDCNGFVLCFAQPDGAAGPGAPTAGG